MPTAIELSSKTVSLIAETLNIPERDVRENLEDATEHNFVAYYVRDVQYRGAKLPYLIYNETEFLDDFATMPKGIDDHFVKVTQVESP